MESQNSGWCVRVGDRLYSYFDGDDTIEIRTAFAKYQGTARLLVPLVSGGRLLVEDQARHAAAAAEVKAIADEKANIKKAEARDEVHKSGTCESDEVVFFQDVPEDRKSNCLVPNSGLEAEPSPLRVVVFQNDELISLAKRIKGYDSERADRMMKGYNAAQRMRGLRALPANRQKIVAALDALAETFPNFAEAVDWLQCELAIAMSGLPEDFRVSPVLLVGEPGIGKTAFCRAVGEIIGGRFEEFSAGGAQGGFDLCGTSSHWGNSAPGRVFEAMAEGDSACAVFLIDEVDKMRGDHRFPVLPTLLSLTEKDSAAQFRDESLGIKFDASKAIVVMTANGLSDVPPPLLSRVQVIEISGPTVEQRRTIMAGMLADLPAVGVPSEALDRLARSDIDLREVRRRLRRAVGDALARGSATVAPRALAVGQYRRRAVGFVS